MVKKLKQMWEGHLLRGKRQGRNFCNHTNFHDLILVVDAFVKHHLCTLLACIFNQVEKKNTQIVAR